MPERIVDVLEPVDVDHQHRQERTFATRLREAAGEALGEENAVGDVGEMVRARELVQSLFHALALADVA